MKLRSSAWFTAFLIPLVAACAQSPQDTMLAGLGGETALQNMSALSIEATGTRWEIDELYSPGAADEEGIPFTMQLHHDVAGDRG